MKKAKTYLEQLNFSNGGTIEEVKTTIKRKEGGRFVRRLRRVDDGTFLVSVMSESGHQIALSPSGQTEAESIVFYKGLLTECGVDVSDFTVPIDWPKWELIGRLDFIDEEIAEFVANDDGSAW